MNVAIAIVKNLEVRSKMETKKLRDVNVYTSKREYEKAKLKHLKFLQKTYRWYVNIRDGMESWEKRNRLVC